MPHFSNCPLPQQVLDEADDRRMVPVMNGAQELSSLLGGLSQLLQIFHPAYQRLLAKDMEAAPQRGANQPAVGLVCVA